MRTWARNRRRLPNLVRSTGGGARRPSALGPQPSATWKVNEDGDGGEEQRRKGEGALHGSDGLEEERWLGNGAGRLPAQPAGNRPRDKA